MATWLQRELNADAGQVRCNRWAWLAFEGEVQEAKGRDFSGGPGESVDILVRTYVLKIWIISAEV
jgi:hypothetical protein